VGGRGESVWSNRRLILEPMLFDNNKLMDDDT
jgi:hypothetical protein